MLSLLVKQNMLAQSETTSIRVVPEILVDTTNALTIQNILEQESILKFKPSTSLGQSSPNETYWIKVNLHDNLEKLSIEPEWALSIGSFDESSLYYQGPDGIQELNFGYFSNMGPHKRAMTDTNTHFNVSGLIYGDYLYIKCRKLTSYFDLSERRVLLNAKSAIDARNDGIFLRLYKRRTPAYVFAGLVIIVLLFSLSAFIVQKRKEYLYYSFYLFALLAYLTRRPFGIDNTVFANAPLLDYVVHSELQVLINLCYTLFAKHFLNTKVDYPKLDKAINIVVYLLIAFVAIDTLFVFMDQFTIHLVMMDAQRYFMACFGIIGSIYLLVKRQSPLVFFIVIGSFTYTVGALATLFLLDLYYILAGSSIEIFIFTLGLGYKSRSILVENSQIQQEVLQLEMKALRAQMNPHFIFNSLGSIQHLIRRDLKKEALQYLSKFSQLLRQILDNSNNGSVSLKEEIDLLTNYIELESLRFNGRFSYELTVSESLDVHNLEIPILLVQPHVENAILHGLLPKKNRARLEVSFSDAGDNILCQVRDNGIGRQKSAEQKSQRGVTHQSRGLSIVADRVSHLHGKETDSQVIEIEDVCSEEGAIVGTLVSIHIPKDE